MFFFRLCAVRCSAAIAVKSVKRKLGQDFELNTFYALYPDDAFVGDEEDVFFAVYICE